MIRSRLDEGTDIGTVEIGGRHFVAVCDVQQHDADLHGSVVDAQERVIVESGRLESAARPQRKNPPFQLIERRVTVPSCYTRSSCGQA
jgi:hypothetical protein